MGGREGHDRALEDLRPFRQVLVRLVPDKPEKTLGGILPPFEAYI